MHNYICIHCNKPFSHKLTGKVYCSASCQRKHQSLLYKLSPRTCPVCKKEYQPTEGTRKYCSLACYFAFKKSIATYKREYTRNLICYECNKGFVHKGNYIKFCSNECRIKNRHNKRKINTKYCLNCKKEYVTSNKSYCSIECYYDHLHKVKVSKAKICEYCGKAYIPKTKREQLTRKYCSPNCARMSFRGKNCYIDNNQPQIVEKLKELGCSVLDMTQWGYGIPDLLVGFEKDGIRCNYLLEIKNKDTNHKLTESQSKFIELWKGQISIVYNIEDIINLVA